MWYVCNNSKSFYQELEGDECGMFVTIASLFSVFYQELKGDDIGICIYPVLIIKCQSMTYYIT